MQRNNTPVLLITIVLGVLALGATAFLLLRPAGGPPANAPVAVAPTPKPSARWVAARDIPPRTVIDPSMLRRDFRTDAAAPDAITSIDDVRGQLTSEPIGAGETVLRTSFVPGLQRQIPANIPIPAGMRGVAIWVDPDQTAAGLVDVGDHIDVIANHRMTVDRAPKQFVRGALQFTEGRTIAQNLVVLGVDRSIKAPAPTPTPVPGAPAAAPPPPTPVPVAVANSRTRILVAAPPATAADLVAANDQGTLHITIRNPIDADTNPVPEAREYPSTTYFASSESASKGSSTSARNPMPVPVAMPTLPPVSTPPVAIPTSSVPSGPPEPATQEITVIRGTEKTRVIVPQR